MKSLLALLLLLPHLSHAEAPRVLQQIQVDLDGDGKADTVSILSVGTANDILEISFSASGRKVRFEKLLRDFPFYAEPDHGCASEGENSLKAGKGSFTLHQRNRSIDACAGENGIESTVDFVNGELRIRSAMAWSICWSMGDPCPGSYSTFDFVRKTIRVKISDAHDTHEHPIAAETIAAGCKASLSLSEIEQSGLPECLSREASYMADEIRGPDAGDGEGGPTNICPILDGGYTCTYLDDGKPATEAITSIRRNTGKIFQYDIRGYDHVLITDGKKYPPRYAGSKRDYDLSTCRRDTLAFHRRSFTDLSPGDKDKPLYDRLPTQKEDTVWKQLDDEGSHFSVTYKKFSLKEDGTYSASWPWDTKVMDCKRQQ